MAADIGSTCDAILEGLDPEILEYIKGMIIDDQDEEETGEAVTSFLVSAEYCADDDAAAKKTRELFESLRAGGCAAPPPMEPDGVEAGGVKLLSKSVNMMEVATDCIRPDGGGGGGEKRKANKWKTLAIPIGAPRPTAAQLAPRGPCAAGSSVLSGAAPSQWPAVPAAGARRATSAPSADDWGAPQPEALPPLPPPPVPAPDPPAPAPAAEPPEDRKGKLAAKREAKRLAAKSKDFERARAQALELDAQLEEARIAAVRARAEDGAFLGAIEAAPFCLPNPGGGADLLEHGAAFTLVRGRRYGLMGRNGKGKSTLLRALAARQVGNIPAAVTVHYVSQVGAPQLCEHTHAARPNTHAASPRTACPHSRKRSRVHTQYARARACV